jgi:hypothetical protein
MSQLYYFVTKNADRRLERFEKAERRLEGSRARAARSRRQASEASWR